MALLVIAYCIHFTGVAMASSSNGHAVVAKSMVGQSTTTPTTEAKGSSSVSGTQASPSVASVAPAASDAPPTRRHQHYPPPAVSTSSSAHQLTAASAQPPAPEAAAKDTSTARATPGTVAIVIQEQPENAPSAASNSAPSNQKLVTSQSKPQQRWSLVSTVVTAGFPAPAPVVPGTASNDTSALTSPSVVLHPEPGICVAPWSGVSAPGAAAVSAAPSGGVPASISIGAGGKADGVGVAGGQAGQSGMQSGTRSAPREPNAGFFGTGADAGILNNSSSMTSIEVAARAAAVADGVIRSGTGPQTSYFTLKV